MKIDVDNLDRERLNEMVMAIVHDLVRLPGQAGLDDEAKFAVTMEALTLISASIIKLRSPYAINDKQLLETVLERSEIHLSNMRAKSARRGASLETLLGQLLDIARTMPVSVDKPIRCPFCHKDQEVATATGGRSIPVDGDATLCFACGEIAIFDEQAPYGARKPKADEQAEIDSDPKIALVRRGWKDIAKQRKETTP